MSHLSFIQSLEPRQLLSASTPTLSADLADALSEIKAVRGVLMAARSTELADRKTFLADLRPASSRSNAKVVAQLERDDTRDWAKTFAGDVALMVKGSFLCRHDTADGILLLKRTGDGALSGRVSAEASALGGKIAALLSAVQDRFVAANQARDADLSAIISANPSIPALAGDLQAAENHLAGASAELGGTSALAQSQVNTLATDLATITSYTLPN